MIDLSTLLLTYPKLDYETEVIPNRDTEMTCIYICGHLGSGPSAPEGEVSIPSSL